MPDQQILSTKVRSLEAALAALGPEESVAKTEIAGALKRVREQEVESVRVDPDAKVVAARDKVARPDQPIAAMGDFKGPEMDTLVTGSSTISAQTSCCLCARRASVWIWWFTCARHGPLIRRGLCGFVLL